jgi:prepilin-type N-terminal cleavage/methylation domain-containing protein
MVAVGRRCQGSGFTLVELLVVIALLVLLCSLLMPILGSALDRAKESQCTSGMRRLGIAFAAYMSENDFCFPKAATSKLPVISDGVWQTDGQGNKLWSKQITWESVFVHAGYVKRGTPHPYNLDLFDTNAFMCPSDPRQSYRGYRTSYFMPTSFDNINPTFAVERHFGAFADFFSSESRGFQGMRLSKLV